MQQIAIGARHRIHRRTGEPGWASTGPTRLYRIAYSKPTEKAMDSAREQSKGGQPVVKSKRATPEAPAEGGTTTQSQGEPTYESKVMLPSDLNPKT